NFRQARVSQSLTPGGHGARAHPSSLTTSRTSIRLIPVSFGSVGDGPGRVFPLVWKAFTSNKRGETGQGQDCLIGMSPMVAFRSAKEGPFAERKATIRAWETTSQPIRPSSTLPSRKIGSGRPVLVRTSVVVGRPSRWKIVADTSAGEHGSPAGA